MTEQGGEKLVDIGRWLYGGSAESIVHLVETNVAFGSGDHQDAPDVRDDRAGVFYVLKFFDPENHEKKIFNNLKRRYCHLSRSGLVMELCANFLSKKCTSCPSISFAAGDLTNLLQGNWVNEWHSISLILLYDCGCDNAAKKVLYGSVSLGSWGAWQSAS